MKCKICNSNTSEVFRAKIINKYDIGYFQCSFCNFLQTEKPYWLEEAYSSAISSSDTGIIARNEILSKVATFVLRWCCDKNGKFLDFGGGYGIFTRIMRDYGFDFFWYDKYASNILARGFEGDISSGKIYSGITSFENFEHFEEPIKEIKLMLELSDFILFSTHLLPPQLPQPNDWWYYCLEHGQHVSFYSRKAFEYIAREMKLNFTTNGVNLHILSKRQFSNKLFLLEKLFRKSGLSNLLKLPSRTEADMKKIIQESIK